MVVSKDDLKNDAIRYSSREYAAEQGKPVGVAMGSFRVDIPEKFEWSVVGYDVAGHKRYEFVVYDTKDTNPTRNLVKFQVDFIEGSKKKFFVHIIHQEISSPAYSNPIWGNIQWVKSLGQASSFDEVEKKCLEALKYVVFWSEHNGSGE